MHHARSNTLHLKTQTMTASEKSEGNTKRTLLNKMSALSARGIIFMNSKLDYSDLLCFQIWLPQTAVEC